ncbi:terminase gpA endonuclease subunit [Sphingomonas sp. RB3P16]|uniref:terminase gpA endonuclease subunit n=1 Tax=Parasphingomonas frigoris TaxID=3096163 RepID=UPI002FCAEC6F
MSNYGKRMLVRDRAPAYRTLQELIVAGTEAISPPERLTVSEAAAKYIRIKEKNYSGPWSAEKTPYVVEPQDVLTSLDFTGMCFVGPARTGKALALTTPVPVPSGWVTQGDLRIQDQVFDESGSICNVTGVTETMHDRPCYKVVFSDGDTIIADAEHEWLVVDSHRPSAMRKMTTAEIYPSHRYGKSQRARYAIEIGGRLDLPEANLPLHPYVLGAWLGDGSTEDAAITSGAQDVKEMTAILQECGIPVRASSRGVGKAFYIRLSDKRYGDRHGSAQVGRSPVSQALLTLGMCFKGSSKFIPPAYLRSSSDQRIGLLQGLMDTDGHVDRRGQLEYCTTSPAIAEGFSDLLSGLGYKYCLVKRPAASKMAYRFMFYAHASEVIFRLPRKQKKLVSTEHRRRVCNSKRFIKAVEPIESVPVRCIEVDSPSHLYLAGKHMTPTHNSAMWLNWLAHSAKCDPADMMLLQMSQGRAREFSLSDLKKMLRNSPKIAEKLVPGRINDNVFDKTFISGMRATIVHPSVNELSGKTSGRNWAMDYDRLPSSIDGEGDAWTMLYKRAETLGRYGMTVAESSPGFPVTDAKWIAEAPHEAPPCEGALSIYNDGDRRRWQWSCPQCHGKFEPDFHLFSYPDSKDAREAAEQVTLVCPHDGFPMTPDMQHELNLGGKWIKEGEVWLPDDTVVGTPRRSDIASFWLKGPAAAFNTWPKLVMSYLNAKADYDRTGSEEKLKAVTNTSFGLPYTLKALEAGRLPDELKNRARAYNDRGTVPMEMASGGFLLTMIDVQAGGRPAFVVHTFGIVPVLMAGGAWSFDIYHVDMWKITKSRRLDKDGDTALIDPAAFKEDWLILIDEVIERDYPLADGSGRTMRAKLVACDSGGAASATAARLNAALDGPVVSVTSNAYDFWRYLRLHDPKGRNYHNRFHLLKGEPSRTAAPLHVTFPDAQQKDKFSIARGDVPVWAVNSNPVKDQVNNMLGRSEPGGQVHFPIWLEESGEREDIDWLFKQLTSEIRVPAGWRNVARRKNEAFDLLAYCVAFLGHRDIRIDTLDWMKPAAWFADWDHNDHVSVLGVAQAGGKPTGRKTLAELADDLM